MAVYIDNFNAKFGRMIMCHMIAYTTDELLEMADKIGVQRKWIQYQGTYNEHFDVCLSAKKKAISFGAIEIGMRDYARFCEKKMKTTDKLKKHLKSIWSNSCEKITSCKCGKRKNACYKRLFISGYIGSNYANIQCSIVYSLIKKYDISYEQIIECIIDTIKNDYPLITQVGIKSPGDCSCSNARPVIFNSI